MKFDEREEIQKLFKIQTKDSKIVPFKFNDVQNRYYEDRTLRDIILKARQMGMSSAVLAIWLMDCILYENTRAVVISHDKESTQRLLARVRFYIDTLPLKPYLQYESRNEMFFPKTNSWFYIGTAGAKAFGRGDTITHLHASEVAFWENPTILTGLFQAVPISGRIVLETTANGYNHFQKMWTEAKEGRSGFKPHFFPWHSFQEYRSQTEAIDITHDEEELKTLYNLDNKQIGWRRQKIQELSGISSTYSPEEQFQQEYPSNDFEAFLLTGNPAFSSKALLAYKTKTPKKGNFIEQNGQIVFEPNERGLWDLYKVPEDSQRYYVGADVAEGLEGGDYSSAVCADEQLEQVAKIKCHLDVEAYGKELVKAARYYNQALLGIERNNQGLAVLQHTKSYRSLYYMQAFDLESNKNIDKMGWRTDGKTKPAMIADMAPMIRQHQTILVDEDTINECLSFVNNNGKFEASAGSNDDLVIAVAIVIQIWKSRQWHEQGQQLSDGETADLVNVY